MLGQQLLTNVSMMAHLTPKMSELGLEYQPITLDTSTDNIVYWKRRLTERSVGDNAEVLS